MLSYSLYESTLDFEPATGFDKLRSHRGLTKDVYVFKDRFESPHLAALVFTDRVQVHNKALAHPVPWKGQTNKETTWFFHTLVQDLVPTAFLTNLGVHTLMVQYCEALPIEFIVRRYLTGRLWRYYQEGQREFAGVRLPEKMQHLEKLPDLIVTPTIKTAEYDFHVSPADLVRAGYLTKSQWRTLRDWVRDLFLFGEDYARANGLVLLDTMFEFGLSGSNRLLLIDEIFTGDTSRFMRPSELEDSHHHRLSDGEFLGKETLRRYLLNTYGKKQLGEPIKNKLTWREILEVVSEKYLNLHAQLHVFPPVSQQVNPAGVLPEIHTLISEYARAHRT